MTKLPGQTWILLPILLAFGCGDDGPADVDGGTDGGRVDDVGAADVGPDSQVDAAVVDSGPPLAVGAPVLNFSDLISGPSTGLNDGLGSGVVVTVWGQGLGAEQLDSAISFTGVDGVEHPAHVYYWKNADGQLPGGPANLFESHRMQEVAFSIPGSPMGEGVVTVTVDGLTSTLPFTVRAGEIFHVMASGDDATGDGSFGAPWRTVDEAENSIDAPGSTLYIHDSVASGDDTNHRAIYWNNSSAASGLDNQFGFVAFPGSQPTATGYSGFRNFNTSGQVVSKFSIFASECDEGPDGHPTNCASSPSNNNSIGLQTSAYGRGVGNAITDRAGGCVDGQQGAISGNALGGRDRVSGYQVLGNEVYDYGCVGTAKFHHTTYLSIRSAEDNLQVDPWRFGWNYLHGNHTKNGIHQFDENNGGLLCGSPNDTVRINDNVIIDQAGAGINIGANCPWTNDFLIYNNVLINVGLAADWDGVDVNTSNGPNTSGISVSDNGLMGTVHIYNNTIIGWNGDGQTRNTQACLGMQGSGDNVSVLFANNICSTPDDRPFVAPGCCGADVQLDNVTGSNNLWFAPGSPTSATAPTWDASAITDPRLSIVGAQVEVAEGSPALGMASETPAPLPRDVYGVVRPMSAATGAIDAARP